MAEFALVADPTTFYDLLSGDYHLLFSDWWEAARWHADVIAAMLRDLGVEPPASVLDCTCGIGTQALPLAALGYGVTGTDASPLMIGRARAEADHRSIGIDLEVIDVRTVAEHLERQFDAVISCDNSLPHLLTDDDLEQALSSIARCLRPGGHLLISIRDYDLLRAEAPPGVPMSVHGPAGSRHASGQAWTWSDDRETVAITLFTLEESGHTWHGSSRETTYRALTRDALSSALGGAAFDHVTWHSPAGTGFYQPIVTARRGA